MPYSPDIVEELNILARFNLDTTQAGIKVHANAAPEAISATQRLFDKGLISQSDGGYLTHRGIEAAEHAQNLMGIMKSG
ncbi:TIGR02647 family protein [Oceanicoccus sagamiensis]|uniref:TIGR02647 family protein n=1 Tax=Oceanicoccus sagamiensis TaxID=716816 RepID=A0A1X9NDD5_9GAMM|nr:TIGR02647 family protein [Oceanicoccus sagamiensis]ARN75064.1 TIGR02647 family protein [Oceanicoccus sagamiensis]